MAMEASVDTAGWKDSHALNLEDVRGVRASCGHISAMWDEKYLYLRVAYFDTRVDPASMTLQLAFPADQAKPVAEPFVMAPFAVLITSDGKCLDPSFADRPRPLPPERVSCETSWDGSRWEARVRLSLTFAHAVGNKVGIAAKLSGAYGGKPAPGLPTFFAATAAGMMHFAY
jgi:hypothetical protein